MKLPNAENAVVDIAKLRDYCLNPNHPKGKHKARIFQDKLGIARTDAERLQLLILDAVLTADAKEREPSPYGRRFIVDFQIKVEQGFVISFAAVRSAWIVRSGEDFPRLTTCFPKGVPRDGRN